VRLKSNGFPARRNPRGENAQRMRHLSNRSRRHVRRERVSGASVHTGGGNSHPVSGPPGNPKDFRLAQHPKCSKKTVRDFAALLVPGDMRAGSGFREHCAHWRRKQYIQSASRPELRRGTGFRSSPAKKSRRCGFSSPIGGKISVRRFCRSVSARIYSPTTPAPAGGCGLASPSEAPSTCSSRPCGRAEGLPWLRCSVQ